MAKKSNKTEQVLKLITKDEEAIESLREKEEQGLSGEQGTDTEVEIALKEKEPQELKYEAKLKIEIDPEIEIKAEKAEPEIEIEIEAEKPEPEIEIEVEAEKSEPESEIEIEIEAEKAEPEPEIEIEVEAEKPEPEEMQKHEKEAHKESDLIERSEHLVNVSEVLVKEKIELVMNKMNVCNCPACVNDILALALNTLPTKYVTTDEGKQYLQLEIYKKQYETDVLAALTKACVRVKAAPRHK